MKDSEKYQYCLSEYNELVRAFTTIKNDRMKEKRRHLHQQIVKVGDALRKLQTIYAA